MSLLFLDTSALIKLFLPEVGSNWIRNTVVSNRIVISELALYECATLLRRRFLEGSFTRQQAAFVYARIRLESRNYYIIELRSNRQLQRVVSLSFNLTGGLRLRALDAIQLSAAQIAHNAANTATPVEPFVFISADLQLLRVAQALGFVTENPENNP